MTFKSCFNPTAVVTPRRLPMRGSLGSLVLPAFGVLLLVGLTVGYSQANNPAKQAASSGDEVHLYHDQPPQGPLPKLPDAKEFDKVVVRNAYQLASSLAAVLYQEPCYCHCSRYLGHTSLLDCYTSKHTAGCPICLKELYYIHEQNTRGRTPVEIREGLARGDWKTVDLQKHEVLLPDPAGNSNSGDGAKRN